MKYNSAIENRRRQEFQYDNINDVYGDLAKEEPRRKKKEKKREKYLENCLFSVFNQTYEIILI